MKSTPAWTWTACAPWSSRCCAWTRAALPKQVVWSWPAALPKPALPALRLKGAGMSEILDITQAQAQLQTHGWIARKSEAFHHLPPPALETWLGTEPAAVTSTQDWQVSVQDGAASVQVQHLSALNAAERATLFADLPAPQGEAAPFAWAHRARCRQGLRIQVAA